MYRAGQAAHVSFALRTAKFASPWPRAQPLRRPRVCAVTASAAGPARAATAVVLGVVPLLWGTYGVAAKALFELPTPVPPPLVNVGAYAAALAALSAARLVQRAGEGEMPWAAGAELGAYLFVGSWLNLLALQYTSASRCAFLVQLTTVLVPLLDWGLGARISRRVVMACCTAFCGALVLAISPGTGLAAVGSPLFGALNSGDGLALAAALIYSIHVIRLERLSNNCASATALVRSKALTQLVLASIVAAVALADPVGASQTFIHANRALRDDLVAAACVVWIGVFTTAVATWAQVVGQKRVGPSRAAVVYASQPVWAAALATGLGIDSLNAAEVFGGLLIAAAGLLALPEEAGRTP